MIGRLSEVPKTVWKTLAWITFIAILIAFLITIFAPQSHAQAAWQAAAHDCWSAYERQWQEKNGISCGSCSGGWKEVTRCAAHQVLPHARSHTIDWCISTIETQERNAPMATDRVGPALSCVAAGN